jgi:tRNA(Ile)-lysidine synthase
MSIRSQTSTKALRSATLPLHAIEHDLIRTFKAYKIVDNSIVLAVSGGRDSMLLLQVLSRISRVLKLKLSAVHIHHGVGQSQQVKFRNRARKTVKLACEKLSIPLTVFQYKGKKALVSENAAREFREKSYAQVRSKNKAMIATAHHLDDLTETRLLRLIRGTGAQGLYAMGFMQRDRIRPFLFLTREKLITLEKYLKISFVQDPSNETDVFLRNWLRQKWLPILEKKYPGASQRLGLSLQHISQTLITKTDSVDTEISTDGILLKKFKVLSRPEQEETLARFMRTKGLTGYTKNHIDEVLKQLNRIKPRRARLDNRQNDHRFTLLKHVWIINAQQLSVQPI